MIDSIQCNTASSFGEVMLNSFATPTQSVTNFLECPLHHQCRQMLRQLSLHWKKVASSIHRGGRFRITDHQRRFWSKDWLLPGCP
jgi:hypothetical protein